MKASEPGQYIELVSGHESYAIAMESICEIITMRDITEIPRSRSHIKGITNFRSSIIPVVSLRARLGLPEQPYTKAARIVVVHAGDDLVGIMVDRVIQVITLQHIEPPSERVHAVFLSGISTTEDGLISILDLDQLLLI